MKLPAFLFSPDQEHPEEAEDSIREAVELAWRDFFSAGGVLTADVYAVLPGWVRKAARDARSSAISEFLQ